MPPDVFWRMTLPELIAGADGFAMTLGNEVDRPPYVSRAEMMAWEAELRARGEIKD